MRSQTDYILGMYFLLLQNVPVQYTQYKTDHYLVMSCLRIAAITGNFCYLRRRRQFLLWLPKAPGGIETLFTELQGGTPKPP